VLEPLELFDVPPNDLFSIALVQVVRAQLREMALAFDPPQARREEDQSTDHPALFLVLDAHVIYLSISRSSSVHNLSLTGDVYAALFGVLTCRRAGGTRRLYCPRRGPSLHWMGA
jgi:hypothetical protein